MSIAEERIAQIGLKLPGDGEPVRTGRGVCAYKRHEDLLFITGLSPLGDDGRPMFTGRLGGEISVEDGYRAARLAGLNMLGVIQDALGDVDRVEQIVKATVLVNGVQGFTRLPEVADGFTDVMTEALGARGMHARSAMGATNLDGNVPVICDAIIQVRE